VKLDWSATKSPRLRPQIPAQEREIRMLQRAGVPTASAELLLSRMRAKLTISAASGRRYARPRSRRATAILQHVLDVAHEASFRPPE
jgi:hypothetical protein